MTVRAYPAHQPPGSRARHEADLWREYSLALMFSRSVPEWIPDETISARLRELEATTLLPWQFSEQEWESLSCPSKP